MADKKKSPLPNDTVSCIAAGSVAGAALGLLYSSPKARKAAVFTATSPAGKAIGTHLFSSAQNYFLSEVQSQVEDKVPGGRFIKNVLPSPDTTSASKEGASDEEDGTEEEVEALKKDQEDLDERLQRIETMLSKLLEEDDEDDEDAENEEKEDES
ncbi:hypothetical protein [Alkalicoccus chagannorensis]|uniref:hypothetical protein n=1 Tax=Alkalicoccus chagannorensis TaxID=427072 RepID=UPI0003F762DD|nr:hypothetical protein [Alkalicoccus chagannorensis]